jgi:hypothetical protein
MAVQPRTTTEHADALLDEHVDRMKALVRERYPDAAFQFGPGPEANAWLLWAHLPVEDDLNLELELAERAVDLLVEDGISLTVVTVPRDA